MRGMLIIGFLLGVGLVATLLVAWPSDADRERAKQEVDLTSGEIERALQAATEAYRVIAEKKHSANRLKTDLEGLRRRLALVRHSRRQVDEAPLDSRWAELDRLHELKETARQLLVDARDFEARTAEIKRALETFIPVLREVAALREKLADLEKQAATANDHPRVRALRAAIETSATKEELVARALEAFSTDLATGRVLEATARNELDEVIRTMKELAGD
ncbi:MAG: hypothetical protein AB1486_06700 [Planctomycetota bacterium]